MGAILSSRKLQCKTSEAFLAVVVNTKTGRQNLQTCTPPSKSAELLDAKKRQYCDMALDEALLGVVGHAATLAYSYS